MLGFLGSQEFRAGYVLFCFAFVSVILLVLSTVGGAFAGLLLGEPLRRSAIHHFRWAHEQAEREPERWSPVLREQAPGRVEQAA